MPKMYPHTNHIALPYDLFWSKVKSLELEVLSINANDQLVDQSTIELH